MPGVADWAAAPVRGRVYCTGLNYSMAIANRACAGRIHPRTPSEFGSVR